MNQCDFDLEYLIRQRQETLIKLAKIEEKIEKLRGPKSIWSTVKTFITKTCSSFGAFIARAFCRQRPDSTKSGELPRVIVTDTSETTPLLGRRFVDPSQSFLRDLETPATTPARRRPASLSSVPPTARLHLASDTPVPATPTYTLTPAMRLLHPSPAWRNNLLASASPLPRPAATPLPLHCQDSRSR